MPDRKGERSSRLRIGGWLAPGHDAPGDTTRTSPPTTRALPANSGHFTTARPGTAPGLAATEAEIGRHRAGRRWWRLAAATAVGIVTVVAIVQTTGDDPGTALPAAAPGPAWPADPVTSWSPSPPEATIPLEPFTPAPALSTSTGATAVSPVPAKTRTRPPTAGTAPVKPALTVTAGPVPALVDLSAEGTRDWVHFGLTEPGSINRRDGGDTIEDLGTTGNRGRYDNNPQLFSWTGGRPAGTAFRTPTGVYACGEGSGFTLRVPAGPATRTLRLYAGVWMAGGRLTTTLNGLTRTSTLENRDAISTNRFVIRFRAPAGSKLTVTWKTTDSYHPTCGNVDMQAATLS